MQGIDWKLYQEDPFYRDLVDRMLENEQEAARLRQQLRVEQAQLDAEATYRRQRMLGYANQLPYRETTPVRPMQWSASYPAYQDNFVNYWSASTQSAVQSGGPYAEPGRTPSCVPLCGRLHCAVNQRKRTCSIDHIRWVGTAYCRKSV